MDPLTTTNYDNTSSRKFGEIYCNYMGVLTFHCVLCPSQMDPFRSSDDFKVHFMVHFRDIFEIKQELQEDTIFVEPDIGISHPIESTSTIKLELPQTSTSHCEEIKLEPEYYQDNDASTTDKSFSDIESTQSCKVRIIDPRKCGICGQTFVIRKLFKNHIRIHQAGPVPKFYECDVCGRRVYQKKNLLTHIRRKHGQKVKCKICQKELRQHYMVQWLV